MDLYFDPERNEYIIEDKGHTLNLKEKELRTVLKNPTGISFRLHFEKD